MEDRKTNKEELTRMATQGGQRERELRDLAVQKEPKNRVKVCPATNGGECAQLLPV